ncbi:MAG: 2-pyrone-4,6-dicarboxylate hydrolase [Cyclobacteriaceae bacterium]|nr:MAG: 2-pyrone-4,6-dicarboxylate hydrolase [Cyclobacteriaceae bacterium]
MALTNMKIFDAHFHIIDPRFPLVSNHGYLPPVFTVDDYSGKMQAFNAVGGAVVSGSFQGFDQEYLIHTLEALGDNYFGVANIPLDLDDFELDRLNRAGVRAIRANLKRGGPEQVKNLKYLSKKLYDQFDWHTELYIESESLDGLMSVLKTLPAFSIDHLGLTKARLDDVYRCVELGAKVKSTGFGRIDFDPIPVMKKIMEINPTALLFGTDLPSTRAKVPFSERDIELIEQNFEIDEQRQIFYKNAISWYSHVL